MSNTEGEEKPVRRRTQLIGVSAVVAALAVAVTGISINAHAAQVQADAHKALAAAAPAYQGAISLGGNLDELNAQSVQAKAAFDAEQARLAAEKAAQEAAAQAAAAAAAQAAADEAARQASRRSASDDSSGSSGDSSSSGPVKCPAGTHANAVDGNGNESACEANGPGGEVCQAYDDNNNCTNWYKP